MKPIGKTFLIRAKRNKESYDMIDGIYVPNSSDEYDLYYEGILDEFGTGWNDNEIKKFDFKIGDTVFIDYNKKKEKTKLILYNDVYYIIHECDLIAKRNED